MRRAVGPRLRGPLAPGALPETFYPAALPREHPRAPSPRLARERPRPGLGCSLPGLTWFPRLRRFSPALRRDLRHRGPRGSEFIGGPWDPAGAGGEPRGVIWPPHYARFGPVTGEEGEPSGPTPGSGRAPALGLNVIKKFTYKDCLQDLARSGWERERLRAGLCSSCL